MGFSPASSGSGSGAAFPSQWTVDPNTGDLLLDGCDLTVDGGVLSTNSDPSGDRIELHLDEMHVFDGSNEQATIDAGTGLLLAGNVDLALHGAGGAGIDLFGNAWSVAVSDAQAALQSADIRLISATLAFFGAFGAAQQTIHSATATPESIALALEASTLMAGD